MAVRRCPARRAGCRYGCAWHVDQLRARTYGSSRYAFCPIHLARRIHGRRFTQTNISLWPTLQVPTGLGKWDRRTRLTAKANCFMLDYRFLDVLTAGTYAVVCVLLCFCGHTFKSVPQVVQSGGKDCLFECNCVKYILRQMY